MGKIIQLKTNGQRASLREAQETQQLIRLWRGELEHGSFCGYVGGVGREFFLLWVIGDGISYDGMYIMRHRDISELEVPDKHQEFLQKALALKGIVPTPPADFPLDDIGQVVEAASKHAPVIGVHVDSEDEAEVCYIGRLVSVEEDGFNMQEITPDAEWLREPSFFSWDEVSTVSLEDAYAQSLLAVAGDPPPLEQGDAGGGVGHAN
ncbi:hypothetical protein FHW69_001232 [Luteibacter sp. Sphag1AF]|uniref:hypothetical protein n=1 Tax=Luteibacter sp. Sphag1AF TaxID=2587031 RepID=UPI0016101ACC|nr:hypothetical protein [Luteibacter sp. Sphag1AF]MBB3226642.1 hypothetical protein [Luteibacter sp. Sphag1AF]